MHTQSGRFRAGLVVALVLAMAFTALVSAVPPSRANHDTVAWSRAFDVATTGNDEGMSSVLADGRGTFYVFYLNTDSTSGLTDVYSSKWTTRGVSGEPERLGSDVRVNDILGDAATTNPFFGLPQIPRGAIDHTGNLYVAWTSSAYDVMVSKSTDQGDTWLPAVKANSATAPTASDVEPSIVITGTGPTEKIWVAWSQLYPSFTGVLANITVSHSDNLASTFIGYTNVSGQGGKSTTFTAFPSLAADSLGRLYLTYTAIEFTSFQLYANYTWSDGGAVWASPRSFGSSAGGFFPVVSVDGKDRVHLAWLDMTRQPSSAPTIYYIRSDSRGIEWTPKLPINGGRSGPSGNSMPSFAISGDTVMFAWDAQTFTSGLGYVISADGGDLWYAEQFYQPGFPITNTALAVDENGTVYAGWTRYNGVDSDTGLSYWDGPTSRPVITSVARGTSSLTVSWVAVPELDVAAYRVWRSTAGSSYELVAVLPASGTTYADSGLANGTYSYEVTAVDLRGTSSHPSVAVSATVGMTTQEMIDALNAQIVSLQAEISALQSQLTSVNASLSAQLTVAQIQISSLQAQLTALQNSEASNNAAVQQQLNRLQANLTNLQNQLTQARAEAATQTMSYVNTGFEILVVVLLAAILVMQMRRPKSPQMLMAEPRASPKRPDEEL